MDSALISLVTKVRNYQKDATALEEKKKVVTDKTLAFETLSTSLGDVEIQYNKVKDEFTLLSDKYHELKGRATREKTILDNFREELSRFPLDDLDVLSRDLFQRGMMYYWTNLFALEVDSVVWVIEDTRAMMYRVVSVDRPSHRDLYLTVADQHNNRRVVTHSFDQNKMHLLPVAKSDCCPTVSNLYEALFQVIGHIPKVTQWEYVHWIQQPSEPVPVLVVKEIHIGDEVEYFELGIWKRGKIVRVTNIGDFVLNNGVCVSPKDVRRVGGPCCEVQMVSDVDNTDPLENTIVVETPAVETNKKPSVVIEKPLMTTDDQLNVTRVVSVEKPTVSDEEKPKPKFAKGDSLEFNWGGEWKSGTFVGESSGGVIVQSESGTFIVFWDNVATPGTHFHFNHNLPVLLGEVVDAVDERGYWLPAMITGVFNKDKVFVHYLNWSTRYDRKVPMNEVAPANSKVNHAEYGNERRLVPPFPSSVASK
jgi:hypothetical protein